MFTLRKWELNDLDDLVKYANNSNVSKFMTNKFPCPYLPENGKEFIEMAMKGNPANIFAIEIDGHASGGIGLHLQADVHEKNAELGYWLAEPFWGNGIITNAIKEMVTYGFSTFQINRIFAVPFGTNISSQKVLEKAGFVLEARFDKTIYKNGEYLDELVYAVRK